MGSHCVDSSELGRCEASAVAAPVPVVRANVRRDFVHKQSSRLAKTHSHLVVETLCTSGLMRTRLSRSIADSAWALFATLLTYKVAWYGGALTLAHRFYPSTRRCSACGHVGEALPLSKRTFRCSRCGHEADRDTNAAACLRSTPEKGGVGRNCQTLKAPLPVSRWRARDLRLACRAGM
jgi:putative transposase